MRELKFRAYDKVKKEMLYNVSINSQCGAIKEGYGATAWTDEAKAGIPMQYTGFKDFDGKEIYEGDILQYVSYCRDENKRTEIVQFDITCGGWYVHKQASTLADVLFQQHNEEWQIKQNYKPSEKQKVRIIGNIYDNPDLIK